MFISLEFEDVYYDNTSKFLEDHDVQIAHYVLVGVCVLYIPIIVSFNILVFFGILLYPGFHNPNNYLLLSLSIADFMSGVFCLPMYIVSYLPYTYEYVYSSKYLCLTWFASIEIGLGGSLASLFFITIDRYIAVMWHARYPQLVTVPRTIKAIVFKWVFMSLLAFAPILFDWNNYDPTLMPITARCNFHKTLPFSYVSLATFGTVLSTLTICAILCVHIVYVAQRQFREFRITLMSYSEEEILNFEARIDSVKITFFLMLLFIILLTPYMVIAPFKYYKVFPQKTTEILRASTLILTFTNSIVNAPIYALFRNDHRMVYKVMLTNPPTQWMSALRSLHRTNKAFSSVYSVEISMLAFKKRLSSEAPSISFIPPTSYTSKSSEHNTSKPQSEVSSLHTNLRPGTLI